MSRTSADAVVGMMDAAYFIGRKELLDFFNELLDLNLSKIEQTATGAIACQVMELIFPGSIPMSKVNWSARSDYEFVQNYKLLQNAFTKHHVQRHVDVDKLIRAKYQDNLEFCQWLKAFADQSGCHREDYDPSAVRVRGKGGAKYNQEMGKRGSSSSRPRVTAKPATLTSAPTRPGRSTVTTNAGVSKAAPLRERPSNPIATTAKDDPLGAAVAADAGLMLKNKDLQNRVEDLELAVLETEKERNFYFEKLRNVEIILQVHQEKGDAADPEILIDRVFKILYATAEDKLTVNDEGEVVALDTDDLEDDDDFELNESLVDNV